MNSTLEVSEGIGEASQIKSSTEKNKRGVEGGGGGGGGGGGAAKLGEEKEAASAEDEERREEAAATTSRDNQSGAEWRGKAHGADANRIVGCEIFRL